ncbi:hypothetical protein CCB80_09725 [Armatimonadetes bacterium Uphvl-Ar1]|nr:hypothetical protein CCB80_09725 [Armatimonadetes bacterium Uphvl-Ar1]
MPSAGGAGRCGIGFGVDRGIDRKIKKVAVVAQGLAAYQTSECIRVKCLPGEMLLPVVIVGGLISQSLSLEVVNFCTFAGICH